MFSFFRSVDETPKASTNFDLVMSLATQHYVKIGLFVLNMSGMMQEHGTMC
jgi:hypothetical protein